MTLISTVTASLSLGKTNLCKLSFVNDSIKIVTMESRVQ